MRRWHAAIALTVVCGGLLSAQTSDSKTQRASFEATSTAIVLDVVVRDRQGQLATDLSSVDFELYEDGVRQTIGSFSVANRGTGVAVSVRKRGPTTVKAPGQEPDAEEEDSKPGVVALVFDRLTPESRVRAQQSALAGLPLSGRLPDLTGVFAIDLSVNVVQGFTRDAPVVRQGINRIGGLNASQFAPRPTRIVELQEQRNALGNRLDAAISQAASNPGATSAGQIGGADAEMRLNRIESRILELFDSLERDEQGYSTANALLAVVSALSVIEGRKTIVFFSEGLAVPPAALSAFRSVVATANRLNVSVYSVDAAGLRAESQGLATTREINATSEERLRQQVSVEEPTTGPMTRVLERQEDLLRLDPHSGLGQLAEETGGFLVRDTNDLKSAFRRIEEDMQFHYVLTFAPSNQDFDGKFRNLDVRVKRPGTRVFSRQGYYAVRSIGPRPILGYEAYAIAALDRTPLPNAFPVRAMGLSFPEADRPGLTPIVLRVGTDALTYDKNQGNGSYNAEAAVVVRLKDESGKVVVKTSQHYLFAGRLDELDPTRKGEILFYREPELLPGVYTMEAIAYDIIGRRGSARVSTITVPRDAIDRLRLSSVVIVRKAEKVDGADRRATNPLVVGDRLLYPSLGEPIPRAADGELAFFYTLYARPGTASIDVRAELSKDGRVLAQAPLPPGQPDATGRMQQVQRIPINGLSPGAYQLRIVAGDGQSEASRSTVFRIEDGSSKEVGGDRK